jgi:hypothetical protein
MAANTRFNTTINQRKTMFCTPDKNLIQIVPNLPEGKTFRILMHEIVHALINESPLRNKKHFGEEEIADLLGFCFIDMLKDNPEIVKWLNKEMKA